MAVKGTCQITLIDMTDAYSVMLTSETHTFQGNSVGAPAGSTCSTEIVAYCGSDLCTKVSITAANIKCPTGISATVSNNNTVSPTVTFKTTAIITGSCEAIIPVVVDDITVNKKFSFAVAKTGAKGDTGATGLPALQPKRNWGTTYTTVGATAECSTTDFNRTPVVGDTFMNLDGSSNTGTWEITAVSGTKVTMKLLSYVKSKGNTGAAGKDGKMLYSTSSTAAATVAKVATISPTTSFSLYTGATVSVYFANANTAASPILNVNSTGAKPIYVYGAAITSVYYWTAKSTVQFTYDGSHWVMNDNSAMSTIASWCYKNDKTIINGGKLAAGSVATNALAAKAVTAAKIDVDDLFAQSITAKKMTITGDSVFEGKLNGATGVFSGNVKADSIVIGNDTGDSFDYGMQINTKGIKMRAGTNNYVDITGGLQVNTRTTTGLLSALEETVAVKGTLTVNGKDIDDMYEPIIKRANAGVYYKEGYQCCLHAWWANATDVFFTVSESYRPKKMTTCVGFCHRKDDAKTFPLMCELEASGAWQVWALTGIGVSGGQGMWVVYQPANGIDHRSEFTVCITGSWLTNTNGGR